MKRCLLILLIALITPPVRAGIAPHLAMCLLAIAGTRIGGVAEIVARFQPSEVVSSDGNWGIVFVARMPESENGMRFPDIARPGEEVAIKISRAFGDPADARVARDSLPHEGAMLGRLAVVERRRGTHFFVRGIHDPRTNALVMEHLRGAVTLEAWMDRNVPRTRAEVERILSELDGAQRILAEAGIVHGDLHTLNILVMPDGSIRIVDLALAAPVGEKPPHLGGRRFGTAAYLSDNQATNGPAALGDDAHALNFVRYQVQSFARARVAGWPR